MTDAYPRRRWLHRTATVFGLGMFAIYIGWNAWWLSHGRLAPALLKALTGLPAPTTGTTRSAKALLEGDLANSLYYNPMTVPIVALVALTLGLAAKRGQAPAWVGRAWVLLLVMASILKLMSPTETW